MEAIDTKAIKDAVAQRYGYQDTLDLLRNFDHAKATYAEVNLFINEVISEVAKQVAEATKQSCADNAITIPVTGSTYRGMLKIISKESILNAPIPEII